MKEKKWNILRSIPTSLCIGKITVIIDSNKFSAVAIGTGQMAASVFTLRVDSCCGFDLMPSKLEEAFK